MRSRSTLHVAVCCLPFAIAASCETPEAGVAAPSRPAPAVSGSTAAIAAQAEAPAAQNPRMTTLARLLGSSESVGIASLRSIDNRAQAKDGFRSTLVFQVEESLKGGLKRGERISLRFPAGYNRDGTMAQITDVMEVIAGRPEAIRVGERFLIFSSRAAYEERVRSDRGAPLARVSQALSVLRIRGDEAQGFGMNALFLRLTEVRTMLEASRETQF